MEPSEVTQSDHDRQGQAASTPVRTGGVGSMPGTSAREASAISAGEFDIPFLPELPARGPGGDMIGRTLALVHLATGELAAETTPTGWRLAPVRAGGDPGRVTRLAQSWLGEDLDAFEEALVDFSGAVKVSLLGPWTLAAAVEGRTGSRLLGDAAACADLTAALREAVQWLVAQIRRRLGGVEVQVQVDECGIGGVIGGRIPTASGRGRLRVPQDQELAAALSAVVGSVLELEGLPLVHDCDRRVPFELFDRAGFVGLSVDPRALGVGADDALGRWWDRGGRVFLGAAGSTDATGGQAEDLARRVAGLWRRIGFGPAEVGALTVLTPSCGLAGASPAYARSVGGVMRRAARMLATVD